MAFTFFFRDHAPLEHAVRFMVAGSSGRSRVRIWDAGCAMGQEPYTLAILLAENMGHFAFRNIEIHATDHDAPLLDILREGAYPRAELQRIPEPLFKKYFIPDARDGYFRVIDSIRSAVSPQVHDLLTLSPIREGLSMVVCKNVLLHLQPGQRVKVIEMFHRVLEPGGIFVMEHTQEMPECFAGLFEKLVPASQVFSKTEAGR